ncbi:MAG: hypothetical protein KDE55_21800 [Novosphingobium sp.]|nr:hypothetical protein [Novosphingobium sp.]
MTAFPVELATGGAAALALAVLAWWGDRRRMRRSNPDAVGFMPWRDVFFWAFLVALILLGLAGREWLAG